MQPGRKVTYGIVQPGAFTVGGVPLIRGQDYINGWQPLPTFFRVARPLHEQYTRSTTTVDDVLLTIVGATTGATAIVPAWLPEANITQTTARLAFDKQIVLPQFGRAFLDSDLGQQQVRRYTKGSAQPGLNLADVEVFRISVPPLSEQQTVMAIASSMAARIQREMRQLRKLRLVKRGLVKDLMTGGNRFTRLMSNGAS
jgi:type I restriction enzyme S subunit